MQIKMRSRKSLESPRSRKTTILWLVLACFSVKGSARAEILTDSGAFSWSSAGVRPLGMGGAFTAMADDANSVFANPAGLSLAPSRHIFYTQADLFNLKIARQQQAAGAFPASGKIPVALGIGYSGLHVDLDPDSWNETVLALSAAKQIYPLKENGNMVVKDQVRVYGGVTAKYLGVSSSFQPVTEISKGAPVIVSVDGGKAKGYGLDFGLVMTVGEKVKAGLAVLDAASQLEWDTQTKESLTKRIRVGLAASPYKGVMVSAEPEMSQQSGKMAVNRASAGAEIKLNSLLTRGFHAGKISDIVFRGGVTRDLADNNGSEMGGGLSLFFSSFTLDYALISRQGGLGLTHRWGFGTSL